jgi:hypothetical protein
VKRWAYVSLTQELAARLVGYPECRVIHACIESNGNVRLNMEGDELLECPEGQSLLRVDVREQERESELTDWESPYQ